MENKINIKELCKRIRAGSKSGAIIWSREENRHFISNRHWLVKFDELPREVTIALFSVFCKIPNVGQSFTAQAGVEHEQSSPINFNKIYEPDNQMIIGRATPFIKDLGNKLCARVVSFPDHYSIVNEDYMKLAVDSSEIRTSEKNHNMPVYLAEGDLLILPYREQDRGDIKTIKDLLIGEV